MSIRPFCIFSDATVIAILETMPSSRQWTREPPTLYWFFINSFPGFCRIKPFNSRPSKATENGGRRRAVAADHFVNGAFLLGKPVIESYGLLIGGLGLKI